MERIDVDVAIVGAGIAGLWLGNLLAQRGVAFAICEAEAVGGAQTAASQGIVHGGLKYALGGKATAASGALAAMPARWRACLAGRGDIDLRGVPLLAEHMHLFAPEPSARVRLFFGSRLTAGQCRRLDATATPFRRGAVVEMDDFVIDVPQLVRRLATPLQDRIVAAKVAADALRLERDGIAAIATPDAEIRARHVVLAAGLGNEALAHRAGFADVGMARRPLRQTSVRLPHAPGIYAHCLRPGFGTAPDMTVTSHGDVLYIGGAVAEDGAERNEEEQIAVVRGLLRRMFPAIDLSGARFDTHLAMRAEPLRGSGGAFAKRHGNCILCWPLKLSLAPRLGELTMALLNGVPERAHGGNAGQVPALAPSGTGWTRRSTASSLPFAQSPFAERC